MSENTTTDTRNIFLPFDRWRSVDKALSAFVNRTAPADERSAEIQKRTFALFSIHALEDSNGIGPDLNASRAAFLSALRDNTSLSEKDQEFVEKMDALDPRDPEFVEKMEALALAQG